eukprot:gene7057-4798_t
MLIKDIPSLKRLIRSEEMNCAPIVAIQEGNNIRAEARFVEAALHRFWVQRVFQQQPKTTERPRAPAGYEVFVNGVHPCAHEVRALMEAPLQTGELVAAARALNQKASTLDAPPALLEHIGPQTLEAYRVVFEAFFLHNTNIAFPLHILLLMLPKGTDLLDITRRRPIGITGLMRRWLMLIICR